MDLTLELQQAADRLAKVRRRFERGEEGLRLLQVSRDGFINSLRATGLTYAEAKIKYDNCLDEQRSQQAAVLDDLQHSERLHLHFLNQIEQQTATA